MLNIAIQEKGEKGIIVPAGEWTVDINGNVNMFAVMTDYDDSAEQITGGIKGANGSSINANHSFSVRGATRQNDFDVSYTISRDSDYCNSSTDLGQNQAF